MLRGEFYFTSSKARYFIIPIGELFHILPLGKIFHHYIVLFCCAVTIERSESNTLSFLKKLFITKATFFNVKILQL